MVPCVLVATTSAAASSVSTAVGLVAEFPEAMEFSTAVPAMASACAAVRTPDPAGEIESEIGDDGDGDDGDGDDGEDDGEAEDPVEATIRVLPPMVTKTVSSGLTKPSV